MRIQRRVEMKRAVRPGCSVRSKIGWPVADPMCTDSQQGPRDATSTIRATVAVGVTVCAAGGAAGVVVRVCGGGGRTFAWWLLLESRHASRALLAVSTPTA